MALTPGTRIGSFEIAALIGVGGMGEVYRATDTNLKRDVAIKVLPGALAGDAKRLARFQREAEVLASLNHPGIAHIYGIEDAHGSKALVMELVEGLTLADRIARGPIPPDEVLPIARQIAEALEAAHEHGIVHRDLKPANVSVRPDGTVKVLDFGLAKAMDAASGLASADQSSPTITMPATTQVGMILGTAAYMSPEQALGKLVDRRTDIWAFGCVLYEMLTGTAAFRGEVVTETLAAVIRADPDWRRLPPATPRCLGVLVRRCLKKDVRQRLQAIGDARIELDEARSGEAELLPVAPPPRTGAAMWIAVGIAAVVIAATSGLVAWRLKPAPVTPREVIRQMIPLPPEHRLAELTKPILAFSPDDRYIAYVAIQAGAQQQIYLWWFEQGAARVVPGSAGADTPFFSEDGQWLGFYNGQNRLMKIPVRGGVAEPLMDVVMVNPLGASWVGDRRIAVASLGAGIQEPSDDGRALQALTRRDTGEEFVWPAFLPGSDALLFNVISNRSGIVVQRSGGDDHRTLAEGADKLMPRYSPSGHVIYAQAGNLMALPFDLTRLGTPERAVPMPVMSGVQQVGFAPLFALSTSGSLAYVPGEFQEDRYTLVQVERDGTERKTFAATPRFYAQPRLSPDGRLAALDVFEGNLLQVWVHDLLRDRIDPFTYADERDNRHGLWTPDSSRLVYQSGKDGTRQIFSRPVEGGESDKLTVLAHDPNVDTYTFPSSFCPDGRLIFTRLASSAELWELDEAATSGARRDPVRLDLPMSSDGAPVLSPDCRWLAYVLDESGRREVYVQSFPDLESKRRISTDGGTEPMWNPDPATRELFYRNGRDMMAIRLDDRGLASGRAEPLFPDRYAANTGFARADYDVFPDGSFLMLKPVERQPLTRINVVLGWSEELKRLAPTD